MFLPNDLTPGEKEIATSIARHLLNQLPDSATEEDRRATRLRAQEVASEQIWASRSASISESEDPNEESLDAVRPDLKAHREAMEEIAHWEQEQMEAAENGWTIEVIDD